MMTRILVPYFFIEAALGNTAIAKLEAARAVSEKRKRERTLPQYILNEWQRDDKEKAAKAAAAAAPPKPNSIMAFFAKATVAGA